MKRSAVCGILSEGCILLLERHPMSRIKGWCLPGGKLDFGENFFEAAIRETKEETGLDIGIPHYAGEEKSADGEYLCKIYWIMMSDKPIVKISPEEHISYKWVSYDDVYKYNLAGYTDKFISLIFESSN